MHRIFSNFAYILGMSSMGLLMGKIRPFSMELFFAINSVYQTFAYFRCYMYDSLNEGALLRSLIKSHYPCVEKQFQWFHNVQLKTLNSQSYFTGRERFGLN